jgi:hypothetical protein
MGSLASLFGSIALVAVAAQNLPSLLKAKIKRRRRCNVFIAGNFGSGLRQRFYGFWSN